jgi:hypothetical protein
LKFKVLDGSRVISYAFVAQWIEHPPPKGRVAGSILAEGTIYEIVIYANAK